MPDIKSYLRRAISCGIRSSWFFSVLSWFNFRYPERLNHYPKNQTCVKYENNPDMSFMINRFALHVAESGQYAHILRSSSILSPAPAVSEIEMTQ